MDEPQLPASEDPWEILGLERDCSERDAKRAYARLIKTFRPDRRPEEFKRVRQAYDLVSGLAAFVLLQQSTDEHAHEHEPVPDPPRPTAAFPEVELPDLDSMVLASAYDDILEALDSPALIRATLHDEALEHSIVSALCATSWWRKEESDRLYRKYGGEARLGHIHGRYSELTELRVGFADAERVAPCPKRLMRLLVLAPFVGDQTRRVLLRDARSDMLASPAESWDALSAIADQNQAASLFLLETAQEFAGYGTELDDLSVDDRYELRRRLFDLRDEVRRRAGRLETLELLAIPVAIIVLLYATGGRAGLAMGAIALAAYIRDVKPRWAKRRMNVMAPSLQNILWEINVSPGGVADGIREFVDADSQLAAVSNDLRVDPRWFVFAALAHNEIDDEGNEDADDDNNDNNNNNDGEAGPH